MRAARFSPHGESTAIVAGDVMPGIVLNNAERLILAKGLSYYLAFLGSELPRDEIEMLRAMELAIRLRQIRREDN
jgi:hypothetical protein